MNVTMWEHHTFDNKIFGCDKVYYSNSHLPIFKYMSFINNFPFFDSAMLEHNSSFSHLMNNINTLKLYSSLTLMKWSILCQQSIVCMKTDKSLLYLLPFVLVVIIILLSDNIQVSPQLLKQKLCYCSIHSNNCNCITTLLQLCHTLVTNVKWYF
jgi:hypothetical protein